MAEVVIGEQGKSTAISITGLRVVFEITKTKTIMPNTARIEIYNLSADTRNKIKDNISYVLLRAGYAQDIGLQDVYKGTILRSTQQRRYPDTVTTIEAQDGIVQIKKRVSLGYPGGTSAIRILNDLINQMGISKKSTSVNVPDRIYTSGFSTVGPVLDSMNRVTRFLGLEWSIQDTEIKFVPVNGADTRSPIYLTPDSGLLGSPIKVANIAPAVDLYTFQGARFIPQANKSGTIQIMFPGWKVRCLLNPALEPKSKVGIKSADITNTTLFTIETLHHKGDTTAYGHWESEIDVYESKK
jgi:hypothetical protein